MARGYEDRPPKPDPCIYGLVDPRTNELRYVGYSADPIARSKQHLIPDAAGSGIRLRTWKGDLHREGKSPRVVILEVVTGLADHAKEERRWIRICRERGCDLLNMQHVPENRRRAEERRSERFVIVLTPREMRKAKKMAGYESVPLWMRRMVLEAMARDDSPEDA